MLQLSGSDVPDFNLLPTTDQGCVIRTDGQTTDSFIMPCQSAAQFASFDTPDMGKQPQPSLMNWESLPPTLMRKLFQNKRWRSSTVCTQKERQLPLWGMELTILRLLPTRMFLFPSPMARTWHAKQRMWCGWKTTCGDYRKRLRSRVKQCS